jgi:hypothetical protein
MDRLSPNNAVEFDPQGHIIPSRTALLEVDRQHPDAAPAEKWRYAQAQTLVEALNLARSRSSSAG